MAIRYGTSEVKRLYYGTSKVKLVYMDSKLIFADPQTVTLNLGTGVNSVTYTITSKDGKTTTGTLYGSGSITVGYGSTVKFSASAASGYTMNTYTSSGTITSNSSYSFSATARAYTTTIDLKYSGTEWGRSVGDLIGTVQYSTNGSTYYTTSGTTLSLQYGSTIYIRSIVASPGFTLSSVTYNGSSVSASSGVYRVTVGAGNYSLSINYAASTATNSASFNYAEEVVTNSISRNAWTVTCNINIKVAECSAGAVIGTIPAKYRPKTAQSFTVNWCENKNASTGVVTSTTQATITIDTNGNITSSAESTGSGSASGGGKWGSYSTSWVTQFSISATWSVK